jgi:hypothetical protein
MIAFKSTHTVFGQDHPLATFSLASTNRRALKHCRAGITYLSYSRVPTLLKLLHKHGSVRRPTYSTLTTYHTKRGCHLTCAYIPCLGCDAHTIRLCVIIAGHVVIAWQGLLASMRRSATCVSSRHTGPCARLRRKRVSNITYSCGVTHYAM